MSAVPYFSAAAGYFPFWNVSSERQPALREESETPAQVVAHAANCSISCFHGPGFPCIVASVTFRARRRVPVSLKILQTGKKGYVGVSEGRLKPTLKKLVKGTRKKARIRTALVALRVSHRVHRRWFRDEGAGEKYPC